MIGDPNNIIRLALIGAGGMGKRWANSIRKVEGVTLQNVTDIDMEKAKQIAQDFPGCTFSSDWRESVAHPEIDAVIVVTPHIHLSKVTILALNANKHVLCEKPGAVKSSDIKTALTLSEKRKLIYMVGFNHRFHDAYLKARKFYEAGEIGEVVFVRARYGFGGREGYGKEWRMNRTISGGGELIDQGVHMIELAISYIGTPHGITGYAIDTFWNSKVDDNAFVLLRNKNKLASIHASLTQWKPLHNFEIYGTRGYISIEGLGRRYGGTEKLIIGKRHDNFSDVSEETTITCNPDADNSLTLELKEFIASIRENRPAIPGGKEAYETLKIVEKIYNKK